MLRVAQRTVARASVRGLSGGRHYDASSLKGKSLVALARLSASELRVLLDMSAALKARMRGNRDPHFKPLEGRSMAMIFQKRSTRTRVSTETAMHIAGGHALFLSTDDIQLGTNESLKDTALVLSRYNDLLLARVYSHDVILELERHATVPVINALSDLYHPLQILADLLTLEERWGGAGSLAGKTLSWVGDGNNVLHSLLVACPKLGMNVRVATPKGYEPNAGVVQAAAEAAAKHSTSIVYSTDPKEAVRGSSVVVTDTWVSMGMEAEKAKRLRDFAGYQVTMDLMRTGGANRDWVFLHCLPRKPEEVDDAVFYSDRSLVFDEAENRMWTVLAVAIAQLNGGLRA
jgi:ornithine carbamoyltransferase